MPTAEATPANAAPDAKLRHPLDRLRGLLRRYLIADGLLVAALVVVGWALLGLVLDYGVFQATNFDWVLDAPRELRAIALTALVVAVLAIVTLRVVLRLRTEFSYASLALVLEKRFPAILGERLITAVELADLDRARRSGYSIDMVRRTIEEARERVGRVPLATVFNRGRLRSKLWLVVGLSLAAVVLLALLSALSLRGGSVAGLGRRTLDVATIWTERNVLLMHSPWPRDAYLEVLEPSVAELRVGKDAGAPRVRVRAYEWVTADAGVRTGWRPLRWGDVQSESLGVSVPATIETTQDEDWRASDVARAAVCGALTMPLERPKSVKVVALAELTVDEVASAYGSDAPALAEVFAALGQLAAQPRMSRTLRKLDAPDAVTLHYAAAGKVGATGKRESRGAAGTRGEVRLARDPSGEFAAEVVGLKESIVYDVRAKDFRTDSRDIVLVPPPTLTRLSRVESQPAYLFHPAPLDPMTGKPGRLTPDQAQRIAPKEFSLTGERSVATVPLGTELDISGVADKPLSQVLVRPKLGKPPGAVSHEGENFSLRFADADRLMANVEFELILIDLDGVRSKRPVLIQVVEDQPPQVELAVDILRKVGNSYYCTPRARVPFVKESVLRDDTGLSQVLYEFTVTRLEAQAVVGLQLQAFAGVFVSAPALPNFGAVVSPTASVAVARALGQGEQRQFATLGVVPFERAYDGLPKSTAQSLAAKLALPHPNPEAPNVVKEVKFQLDSDVFDLERADDVLEAQGRRMRVADSSSEVQPRYRMELNVVATDVNVLTGPKRGQNLEPIRLSIVSEADLLGEITKDEEAITLKFDEALRRLRASQEKLNQQAERLSSPNLPPEILLAARVRAEDISQDVAKARDLVQNVANEYTRLRREVETNRCNVAVPTRYQNVIIAPLEQTLAAEQKLAEDAIALFRDPLLDGRRPEDAVTLNARATLDNLIRRLDRIRRELGDTLSEGKLREDLRKIIENQLLVSRALDGISRRSREQLFAPEIRPVAALTLATGETRTVTHTIDWKLFDKGELRLRLEVTPGSEIAVPAEVVVKDEKDEFSYSVTAGKKVGAFRVKLVPSVGPALEIPVAVK